MAPRVILHIGAAKCGSSAIQAWLRKHHAALLERGVMVPTAKLDTGSDMLGEQIWFMENLSVNPERKDVLRRRFDRLFAAMEGKAQTLVVSAENLCNHPDYAADFRHALPKAQTQVVFYVRRQDDYFISGWQQWYLKRRPTIQSVLEDGRLRSNADWLDRIAPWAEAFGDQAVVVRPFRRDMLQGGDVVQDFLHRLELPGDGLEPLNGLANRSFDEHLGDLANRVSDLFDGLHDNQFYQVIADLIGEKAYKSRSASHLLTLEERLALLDAYAESNEALKRRFMPDLGDGPLFDPPQPSDVATLSDIDMLRAENALLARCVYHLALRTRS